MLPTTTILARRIRQSLNSIALIATLSIGGIAASTSPSSALSPMGSAALASQGKGSDRRRHRNSRGRAPRRCGGWTARQCRGLSEQNGGARPCGARRCRGAAGISWRRRPLGTACRVWLAARRRDRGRRSDRRCHGRNGGRMGRRSTGAGHVLVLHRSVPHAGVLGLLPVGRNPAHAGRSRCRRLMLKRNSARQTRPDRRHGLHSRRHVPHGIRSPLSRGSAGPSRVGRRLLDRPHAGDEPAVQGVRQGDRSRHDRRGAAGPGGVSRRAAAHALRRLARVRAAAARHRSHATGASGGPS